MRIKMIFFLFLESFFPFSTTFVTHYQQQKEIDMYHSPLQYFFSIVRIHNIDFCLYINSEIKEKYVFMDSAETNAWKFPEKL